MVLSRLTIASQAIYVSVDATSMHPSRRNVSGRTQTQLCIPDAGEVSTDHASDTNALRTAHDLGTSAPWTD